MLLGGNPKIVLGRTRNFPLRAPERALRARAPLSACNATSFAAFVRLCHSDGLVRSGVACAVCFSSRNVCIYLSWSPPLCAKFSVCDPHLVREVVHTRL